MDGKQFAKLCKDCGLLCTKFTSTGIIKQFIKFKMPTYAMQRIGIRPPKNKVTTSLSRNQYRTQLPKQAQPLKPFPRRSALYMDLNSKELKPSTISFMMIRASILECMLTVDLILVAVAKQETCHSYVIEQLLTIEE